jgi:hypothetical protein
VFQPETAKETLEMQPVVRCETTLKSKEMWIHSSKWGNLMTRNAKAFSSEWNDL